jgi:hypothetical protein
MHQSKRDITIDDYLLPSGGRGYHESHEGVNFPSQTGSGTVVTYSALQERHHPRTALFWLLALPDEPTPIRHGLSVSAEEEGVREILRANISKLVWGDTCRSIISEFARSPAHESLDSLFAPFDIWITPDFGTLIKPIGQENAASGGRSISGGDPELTAAQPQSAPLSLDWVQALLQDGRQNTSQESFMNMVNGLENFLEQRNFEILDELLDSVDFSEVTPEVMVAFVRTTYQARSKLRAWPGAVQRIKSELTRRGFDSSRVLTGLLS